MPKYTSNYNLIKPNWSESYDIEEVTNINADIIDTELFNKQEKEAGKGLSTNDFTNEYKKKVDALRAAFRFKGNVETLIELNSKTDNNIGDILYCKEDSKYYCWNESWIDIGTNVDLSDCATKDEMKQLQDNIEEVEQNLTNKIEDNTKTIHAPINKHLQDNEAGIDMHNSDITEANGIFMNDESTGHEGINFLKQRRE